ncbi:MAG: L,D-transpeptidase family protein [Chloroflexi bacterium]|nr:L,D-transpeptidase family protein [Chloroflexota bacterium]
MTDLSRRDFLKLSAATLTSLAFSPFLPGLESFNDADLIRITTKSASVFSQPNDQSTIVGQRFRDELINIYKEVDGGTPIYNPIWYRVWGGYIHRGPTQKVKVLFNEPLTSIPEGTRQLSELTVPYSQAMRYTKTYGWQPNLRLYYGTTYWIDGIDEGPDGRPWYRIYDELVGFPYNVLAMHLRPIPFDEWAPITPEVPLENKRIEVNLNTQMLTAYEYDQVVFQTNISSGIPAGRPSPNVISTKTPSGEFRVFEKYPSKHMGNGNLFAGVDDYELPGVPWTSFFTESGVAFHGTYWHDNFGTPMSRGCINMRIVEAKWVFRWVQPLHDSQSVFNRGRGTKVLVVP